MGGKLVQKLPSEALEIEIGAKLKELRVQAGMSQKELGKALGVSFAQVQKYENGRNRVAASTLVQICAIFNVSPMEFLGRYVPSSFDDVAKS